MSIFGFNYRQNWHNHMSLSKEKTLWENLHAQFTKIKIKPDRIEKITQAPSELKILFEIHVAKN